MMDHQEILDKALEVVRLHLNYHPVGYNLLPGKFTMPQLQSLYQAVYNTEFDKGNFNRKLLSTKLLVKLKDKDKLNSKKGAFYYKVDTKNYSAGFKSFLNFVPQSVL